MKLVILTSNIKLFEIFIEAIIRDSNLRDIFLITQNKDLINHEYSNKKRIKKYFGENKLEISRILEKIDKKSRLISFSFGYIFQKKDIERFDFPIINFHTGLIPENRGRTPLFWDILEGKKNSFATLHTISEEIDMGRNLDFVSIKIDKLDTPETLAEKLFKKALEEKIFFKWLYNSITEIRKIKENSKKGKYKKAFKKFDNYKSNTLTKSHILNLWRCYSIWGQIKLNNKIFSNITKIENKNYLKIKTKNNQYLYASKNNLAFISFRELKKEISNEDIDFLLELLKQKKYAISHQLMPSLEEHIKFIKNNPYYFWAIIYTQNIKIGSIYILFDNSVGINLLKAFDSLKSDVIKTFENKFTPLPAIKSVRTNVFSFNINPNDKETCEVFKKNNYFVDSIKFVKNVT